MPSNKTFDSIANLILDQIARGGKPRDLGVTCNELSCDTKLLNALGLMDHYYEAPYCTQHKEEVLDEVNAITTRLQRTKHGFTSRNFEVCVKPDGTNEYFVGNWAEPACPRNEMYKMIAEAAGQPYFDVSQFL